MGMPRAQIIDWVPGRAPCFIGILAMWAFSLKILFIYLCVREPTSERGNTSRGVGEEEAGSQQRSPMRDSFPERRDHALSRRQVLSDCATQAPRVVGFLIFQPAFWARGLPRGYSGNPVWVASPCPLRGGWGWAHCELVFPGFCSLAAFPGGLLCLF